MSTNLDLGNWNRLGRVHIAAMSARLRAFHDGKSEEVRLETDPRSGALAEAVLSEVRRLNAEGRWQEARLRFDAAHEPFIDSLDARGRNLPCAIILGPDSFLVRTGSAYETGETLHIDGGSIRTMPGIWASAISADRGALLTAGEAGFEITAGFDGPRLARLHWPTAWRGRLDQLRVANGGSRVAFADDEEGVWLGTPDGGGGRWTQVHPDSARAAEAEADVPGVSWSDSMTHCALSADGRFIGYGSQCYGHYLDRIDDDGHAHRHAYVDPVSEYPHDACLSHDGAHAAFNSCHFYHGGTVAVATAAVEGREIATRHGDRGTVPINSYLRVYASIWLPGNAVGVAPGAFALAGSGFLSCVAPDGRLVFEQGFGSSGSALDYCPRSRRLLLSSYSGFLHVYDVDEVDAPDRVIGVGARRELYRWVLWKGIEPFRW